MQFIPAETSDDEFITTMHAVEFDDSEKREVLIEMGFWFSLILEHHRDLTFNQCLEVVRKQREYFQLDLLEGDGLTALEGIVDIVRHRYTAPIAVDGTE